MRGTLPCTRAPPFRPLHRVQTDAWFLALHARWLQARIAQLFFLVVSVAQIQRKFWRPGAAGTNRAAQLAF